MKRGSGYAKRVRRLHNQLLRQFGKPAPSAPVEPIDQLIIGILSICTSTGKAQAAYRKLRQQMVDLNELRVTPPVELAALIGGAVPLALDKAQWIVNALNEIRRRQDTLDLSFLKQRGRREAREYLESLDGVNRSAAAAVVLYSLGGHAIPVDDLTLYVLRKEGIVPPRAEAPQVQGFLERHISAAEAPTFAALLGRYVASRAPRIPMDKLGELLRPPAPEAGGSDDGRDAPGRAGAPVAPKMSPQTKASAKELAASASPSKPGPGAKPASGGKLPKPKPVAEKSPQAPAGAKYAPTRRAADPADRPAAKGTAVAAKSGSRAR